MLPASPPCPSLAMITTLQALNLLVLPLRTPFFYLGFSLYQCWGWGGGKRFINERHSYSSFTTCFMWRISGGRGSSKIKFHSIVQVIIKLSLINPPASKCRGYSYEPSHLGFIHIYFVSLRVKNQKSIWGVFNALCLIFFETRPLTEPRSHQEA